MCEYNQHGPTQNRRAMQRTVVHVDPNIDRDSYSVVKVPKFFQPVCNILAICFQHSLKIKPEHKRYIRTVVLSGEFRLVWLLSCGGLTYGKQAMNILVSNT